jgi:hypothetical protein
MRLGQVFEFDQVEFDQVLSFDKFAGTVRGTLFAGAWVRCLLVSMVYRAPVRFDKSSIGEILNAKEGFDTW